MFTVIVSKKPDGLPKYYYFEKTEVVIGRVSSDIILDSTKISKRHTKIQLKDNKFVIVDLRSTNGTFINGHRIRTPQELRETDKITVGEFEILVKRGRYSEHQGDSGMESVEALAPPSPAPRMSGGAPIDGNTMGYSGPEPTEGTVQAPTPISPAPPEPLMAPPAHSPLISKGQSPPAPPPPAPKPMPKEEAKKLSKAKSSVPAPQMNMPKVPGFGGSARGGKSAPAKSAPAKPAAAPAPAPQAPATQAVAESAPAPIPESALEQALGSPFADGKPAPAKTSLKRKGVVRFYEQMNPRKLFPLMVSIIHAQEYIKHVELTKVRQVDGDKVMDIQAAKPYVRVVPILPGCTVYPAETVVDVSQKKVDAEFWVTPEIEGDLRQSARIQLWHDGILKDEIPIPCVVKTQLLTKITAACSITSSFGGAFIENYGQVLLSQEAAQSGKSISGMLLQGVVSLLHSAGTWIGLLFLVAAVLCYLWLRPKESDELQHFLNTELH